MRKRMLEIDEKSLLRIIFFMSFIIRIIIVLVLNNINSPPTWENGGIADNIVAGRGFAISFTGPIDFTSWQAPFYPFFLAFIYTVFGKNTFAFLLIEIIQSIATSLVPIFIYKSANIIFDKSVCNVKCSLSIIFSIIALVFNKNSSYSIHIIIYFYSLFSYAKSKCNWNIS